MFFKDVAGHQTIKEKLTQNVRNRRVSHTQLFAGPEGSGKLALAIAYARYLCCKQPGPVDACGSCSSCRKFDKLAHPDLIFLFPNPSKKEASKTYSSKDHMTNWRSYLELSPYVSLNGWYSHIDVENKQGIINAEDCSDVLKFLGLKSFDSDYKIIIIWMIERLYHSAAPKLLKILEEPPQNTVFLLVSENPDQILNTIISRSQWVRVPRLTLDEIKQGLIENYNCDPTHAAHLAFMADGNFLTALTLMKETDAQDNELVFVRDWLRSCFTFKIKEIFAFNDVFAKMGREKQKALLSYALELFRQCLLFNYNGTRHMKMEGEALDFVQKFATNVFKPEIAPRMIEEFAQAIYHIERNANPKILFTDLSLKAYMIMKGKK